MGQEFIVKSTSLEDKINQLLPSQGGAGAGIDLSASTQIIPIVDLTESAEGSSLRSDLQTSLSLDSCTAFQVTNQTSAIITTTGFFRVFGTVSLNAGGNASFVLTDGFTSKTIFSVGSLVSNVLEQSYDFNVFMSAGDTLNGQSNNANAILVGVTRQIADISGNLINPI